MKWVLVLDDVQSTLKVVGHAPAQGGCGVRTGPDAPSAAFLISEVTPELVILDAMLPGKSGLDVARGLGTLSNVPSIMLCARGDEVDRVPGREEPTRRPDTAVSRAGMLSALRDESSAGDDRAVELRGRCSQEELELDSKGLDYLPTVSGSGHRLKER